MVLIENDQIEAAMVEFGKELDASQTFEGGAKDAETHLVGLRGASLRVARACREELAKEWSMRWLRSTPEEPAASEENGGDSSVESEPGSPTVEPEVEPDAKLPSKVVTSGK